MKLVKVVMTGFRSVKKTEALLVEDKTTVLIGANDHGKSNLLGGAELLNDTPGFVPDDVNWDLEGQDDAVGIEWYFLPSTEEQEKLAALEQAPEDDSRRGYRDAGRQQGQPRRLRSAVQRKQGARQKCSRTNSGLKRS